MQEIWKNIKGYEGLYEVSNLGNVKSLRKNKIMKFSKCGDYHLILLCNNGKMKGELVHRLVAKAFIPNPNNYETVNHIDENKKNNSVDNLEWLSNKDNVIYSQAKKIKATNIKTGEILIFKSTNEVIDKGFKQSNVVKCCKGQRKSHHNYKWEYV